MVPGYNFDYLSRSFLALRDNLDAPAVLDKHPRILRLIEHVHTLPAIKEWNKAERPKL